MGTSKSCNEAGTVEVLETVGIVKSYWWRWARPEACKKHRTAMYRHVVGESDKPSRVENPNQNPP